MSWLGPGPDNLRAMLGRADTTDRREGLLAYGRYHDLMRELAEIHGRPLERVVAAFVSLSPNNSYAGNLRSLVTVLAHEGVVPDERITVSTYGACRARALAYLRGQDFLSSNRGPKVEAFFRNILDPDDRDPVTVDGHMVGAWRGNSGTMKENIPRRGEYERIAHCVRFIAAERDLVPCQLQAIIWFARKRHLGVLFQSQLSLFHDGDDQWRTCVDPARIAPFPPK